MFRKILVASLLAVALLLSGCGDSSDYVFTGTNAGSTAAIRVDHVLARAVPNTIDSFRFSGRDANGQVVYGPDVRAKAAGILLQGLPTTMSTFIIDYLDGDVVVGRFEIEVSLNPGETLVITDPDWVDVNEFGPATQLDVLSQPTTGAATIDLGPISVRVQDAQGRLVANSNAPVTVSLASGPPNAVLSGTLTVSAVNGIATFSDLQVDQAGAYTLQFSSTGLTSGTTTTITVSGAPMASALEFASQPANAAGVLGPFTVRVLDQFGNPFTDYSGLVTLALGMNPSGASLQGPLTVSAVDGVATFSNILVTLPGNFSLIASAPGLTPGESELFAIEFGELDRRRFSLVTPLTTDGDTSSLATGDFNGDGRIDAVQSTSRDGSLHVLLATDEGDFEEAATISLPDVQLVRVGEVTGDDHLDLVAITYPAANSAVLHLLPGTGGGAFGPAVSTVVPGTPDSIPELVVQDLGTDGRADVTFIGSTMGGGSLYTSLSTGAALAAPVVTMLAGTANGLAVGEVIGGGSIDAVVSVSDNIVLLPGQGDGTFAAGTAIAAPAAPTGVTIADFDNRNGNDIAVRCLSVGSGTQIRIFENSGAGSFAEAQGSPYATALQEQGANTASHGLRSGDFSGDGIPDLAVTVGSSVEIYLTDPTPANTRVVAAGAVAAADTLDDLHLADLSGDGRLDANVSSGGLLVRLNGTGDGQLLPGTTPTSDTQSAAKGDVNGDGRVDLVVYDDKAGEVNVYLKGQDGALPDDATFVIDVVDQLFVLRLADMDADGDLDMVGTNPVNSTVAIHLNPDDVSGNPSGNFAVTPTTVALTGNLDVVEIGDLNGDSLADFVTVTTADPGVTVSLANASADLTYTSALQATTSGVDDVRLGDLNGDGLDDIVTAQGDAGVGVFLNDDGTFDEVLTAFPNEVIDAIGVGDLDGDGLPEIVTAGAANFTTFTAGRITVLKGDAAGELGNPTVFDRPRMLSPQEVVIDDANGDAVNDILVSDSIAYGCVVLTGTGDGENFANGSMIHTGGEVNSPRSIVVIDVDGDGRPDPLFTAAGGTLTSLLTLLALLLLRAAAGRPRGEVASA